MVYSLSSHGQYYIVTKLKPQAEFCNGFDLKDAEQRFLDWIKQAGTHEVNKHLAQRLSFFSSSVQLADYC